MDQKLSSSRSTRTLSKVIAVLFQALDTNNTQSPPKYIKNKLEKHFEDLFHMNSIPINPLTGKSNKLRLHGKIKQDISSSSYLYNLKNKTHKRALTLLKLRAHPLLLSFH